MRAQITPFLLRAVDLLPFLRSHKVPVQIHAQRGGRGGKAGGHIADQVYMVDKVGNTLHAPDLGAHLILGAGLLLCQRGQIQIGIEVVSAALLHGNDLHHLVVHLLQSQLQIAALGGYRLRHGRLYFFADHVFGHRIRNCSHQKNHDDQYHKGADHLDHQAVGR